MGVSDIVNIVAVVAVAGGLIAFTVPFLHRRSARKTQRLTMLQQALEHPQLDASTRNQILAALSKEHRFRPLRFLFRLDFWERVVFAGGWLTFLVFGGVSAGVGLGLVHSRYLDFFLFWTLLGLAMMTLPMAVHEFSRRMRSLSAPR